MTGILQGKTVLVTGGARGIGRAISHALAGSGALVAINYAGNDEAARETVAGCCQFNRNAPPIDAPTPELSLVQAASDCHSADQRGGVRGWNGCGRRRGRKRISGASSRQHPHLSPPVHLL